MTIKFGKNSFLNAVKEKYGFNTNGDIFDHVRRKGLKFKYVDVSDQKFSQKYCTKGWLGRKVIAIPAAIWSGVVKTIYHLAKAILVGLIINAGQGNYFKVQFLNIIRDLQESFGWFTILINDRCGQFHLQAAKFHKTCYADFLNNKQSSAPSNGFANNPVPPNRFANNPIPQNRFANNPVPPTNKNSSIIKEMMNDPSGFRNLDYSLRENEDVVIAALKGCKSSVQAENVMEHISYEMKDRVNVALALVRIDPSLFRMLGLNSKRDEDVVIEVLNKCNSAEQAKKVISDSYLIDKSQRIAIILVKIDLALFEMLDLNNKNDKDVILAALRECKTAEQAKMVIQTAYCNAKDNKEVALNLVKIDPSLIQYLGYANKNDEDVVLAALRECKNAKQAKMVIQTAYCNAKNNKEVALNLVKIDPTLIEYLDYANKNDEDVVLAALRECKNAKQAEEVFRSAHSKVRDSKKVALNLVKIDPILFKMLKDDNQKDEDVIAAALGECKNAKQANKVIQTIPYTQNSKKIALMLVEIDPILFRYLGTQARIDKDVVLRVLELSTAQTINEILLNFSPNIRDNPFFKAKIEEKYPGIFPKKANTNPHQGYSSSANNNY